ncbi:MAG: DoxX family protein [Bacteroidetes bacterium]|nr:DoxX family protein [Bacteroidota bacterium]
MIKKILSTKINDTQVNVALLILRLTAGVLMAYHGYGKLTHFSEMQTKFMDFMGLGMSASLALVVFAEFFCSLLLIAGLATRFALIPLIITMLVAVFQAHSGDIFGDGQTAFLYLAIYTALMLKGAGKFSLDAFLFKS